mmetsp:Transcript_101620/g.308259  ORF Transcript_101620/g.308259 Transcript_101620/m.308259 type:complete len:80 (-) Transcript_101620:900-1139(-)
MLNRTWLHLVVTGGRGWHTAPLMWAAVVRGLRSELGDEGPVGLQATRYALDDDAHSIVRVQALHVPGLRTEVQHALDSL